VHAHHSALHSRKITARRAGKATERAPMSAQIEYAGLPIFFALPTFFAIIPGGNV
jgi:hypothetical protein